MPALVVTWFTPARLVAAARPDLARFVPEFIAAAVAVVTLSIVLVYLHRLNARHARLLTHLESELAERRRAEEALRASEGFYHSLVESLPAAILRKDLSGRFTFVNQRFYAALELERLDQVVGKTDLDFYPRELAEKYRADDRRVIATDAVLEAV